MVFSGDFFLPVQLRKKKYVFASAATHSSNVTFVSNHSPFPNMGESLVVIHIFHSSIFSFMTRNHEHKGAPWMTI